MITATHFLLFIGAALLIAITPGPNMVYLISRSTCQGRTTGVMGLVLGVLAFKLLAQQRGAA